MDIGSTIRYLPVDTVTAALHLERLSIITRDHAVHPSLRLLVRPTWKRKRRADHSPRRSRSKLWNPLDWRTNRR